MVELTAPGTRSRLYCWQACTSVQICSRATAGRLVESADCLHLRQRETSCIHRGALCPASYKLHLFVKPSPGNVSVQLGTGRARNAKRIYSLVSSFCPPPLSLWLWQSR